MNDRDDKHIENSIDGMTVTHTDFGLASRRSPT